MILWAIAAAVALVVVVGWSWLEMKADPSRKGLPDLALPITCARGALFVVLAVAVHGAIDPEHDKGAFALHLPQLARAAYAFAVTVTLLVAFPTLRIAWGAGVVAMCVFGMETLQAVGVLPGLFHYEHTVAALAGVAAAAGPMWLGAHRARENIRREAQTRNG